MDVQHPPWLCLKKKYIHMSMLIQGPTQLGSDINLYLKLLKEELDTLWEEGVETWDAHKEETLCLKVALLMPGVPRTQGLCEVHGIDAISTAG
jgi:hypothetical protein